MMKYMRDILACVVVVGLVCTGLYLWGVNNQSDTFNGLLKDAYREGWNYAVTLSYARVSRLVGLEQKHGTFKDIPWDEFTIQEKMMLCAYGSPGNLFSTKDMEDIFIEYGPEGCKFSIEEEAYPEWWVEEHERQSAL